MIYCNIKYKKIYYLFIIFFLCFFLSPKISSAKHGKIKGTVFDDKNCNGTRNAGEMGIPGVLITVNPGSYTDITDHKGKYKIKELENGTYTVEETDPEGYCSTTPNTIIVVIDKKKKKHHSSTSSEGDEDDDDDDDDHHNDEDGGNFGDSRKSISPPAGCCIYE